MGPLPVKNRKVLVSIVCGQRKYRAKFHQTQVDIWMDLVSPLRIFYFTAADLSPTLSTQINFNLRLSSCHLTAIKDNAIRFTNKVKSTLGVRVNFFLSD